MGASNLMAEVSILKVENHFIPVVSYNNKHSQNTPIFLLHYLFYLLVALHVPTSNTIIKYLLSDEHVKQLQNVAYATFIGLILYLSMNLIGIATLWFTGHETTKALVLAVAYLVLGVPTAYVSWHRTLILAFQEKRRSLFKWFFVFYSFHLAFWSFIMISDLLVIGLSLTGGIVEAFSNYSDESCVWIFYLIGFLLFGIENCLSSWVMMDVYMYHHYSEICSVNDDLGFAEP
ncbi:secretory carrier-associated membrane protein 3-like [Mercurialis annua]|uniref:secretory carrier-associated membrane protein 3-like n=1 Tax=Mercurialis annua TaxID=3986 RepID=UPI0024AF219A|nr:secretory carrier-associated membrane protein 3-like [Mercurialis annua]